MGFNNAHPLVDRNSFVSEEEQKVWFPWIDITS
jgi:hypothetical protein